MNIAPTLRYRQGNAGLLPMRLSRAGSPVVPTSTDKLFLELRITETGFPVLSAELTRVSPDDTLLQAVLPNTLKPGVLLADIRFETSGILHRTPLARVEIIPVGSLERVGEVDGLVVNVNETNTTVEAVLDATPAAALVAYYVQQALLPMNNYYLAVPVSSYAAYVAQCTGVQRKIVTVAVDETDSGSLNRYFYEGDNQVITDPIW